MKVIKHEFELFVRSSCHLCNDMLLVLNERLAEHLIPYNLKVIDIANNLELQKNYGQLIPVLTESGNEICHFFFDLNQWNEYFSKH